MTLGLATATVNVRHRGNYAVLVRYEGAWHFSTGFRVRIEQSGTTVFDRRYGMRENPKLWAFAREKRSVLEYPGSCSSLLTAECSWSYGATENWLWEGVGTSAQLEKGRATISLVIDNSTATNDSEDSPEADRNLDVVVLQPNATDIMGRATKYENGGLQLPLDGYMSQAGEVYMKFRNAGAGPLNLTIPGVSSNSHGSQTMLQANS